MQRPAEESRETRRIRPVEQLRIDRGVGIGETRVRTAGPVLRSPRRGHLVQRHRGRVPLGRQIPQPALATAEERVEIRPGAGVDRVQRLLGQGEVEQDKLPLLTLTATLGHPQVVGLDVTVGDPVPLQMLDDLQQVIAPFLQPLRLQPAPLPHLLGQRAGPGERDQQRAAGADVDDTVAEQLHDTGMLTQAGKRDGLGGQTRVPAPVERHLEHRPLAVPIHEQRERGGAAAQPPHDREPAFQLGPGLRFQRVDNDRRFLLDRGQPFPHQVEVEQEPGHVPGALVRVGVCRSGHELVERLRDSIHLLGQGQPAMLGKPLGERPVRRRRRHSGEQVVGDRTDTEDVEGDPVRRPPAPLRREVGGRSLVGQPGVATGGRHRHPGRRLRTARCRLPVRDLEEEAVRCAAYPDTARAQPTVGEHPTVGVRHRLGDPAEQREPVVEGQLPFVLPQKVVEPRQGRVVTEDDRRAEVMLDEVDGCRDTGMVDAAQRQILPLRGPHQLVPLVAGVDTARKVDTDPARPVLGEAVVAGQEVLPARPVGEGRHLQPQAAHRPDALGLADPGLVDRAGKSTAQLRVHPARLAHVVEEARQLGLVVTPEDVRPAFRREPHIQASVAQEDRALDPRHPAPTHSLLGGQQRLQLACLTSRSDDRVVDGCTVRLTPCACVAHEHAGPRLDLQDDDAGRGDEQQVNLVDRTVGAEKLRVRPGPERILVRQQRLEIPQGRPLPRELGRRALLPAPVVHPNPPIDHRVCKCLRALEDRAFDQ